MNKLQSIRGTKDLFGTDAATHEQIIRLASELGERYGFAPFFTPIIEFTEVFKRTLGDYSDVVNKEMYTFEDRGGESITLRPEFTAGIARAFISGGLQQHLPLKLFSYGPLFRYERPQKGRQRQFHQINFEWLGSGDVSSDIDIITLADDLLSTLGVQSELQINSLGSKDSREQYVAQLVEYLEAHKSDLSDDSQVRLNENPLRILDSKDQGDQAILTHAPKMSECLIGDDKARFDAVQSGLDALGISYHVNPHIVRGLDYYNDLVFEFIGQDDEMGAQNTVLAGGRYDSLVTTMGGPATPAIGFAAGIERLALTAYLPLPEREMVALLPRNDEQLGKTHELAQKLRNTGQMTEIIVDGNVGKRFKKANNRGASVIVVVDNELEFNANDHIPQGLLEHVKQVIG